MNKITSNQNIKNIPDNYRNLLAISSLFEKEFSVDWLLALGQQKISTILNFLEHGVQHGILSQKEPSIFCFKSPKEKKKYEEILPQEEKGKLHIKVANILRLDLPDNDAKAKKIAYHLLQAPNGLIDLEGCEWLLRAASLYYSNFQNEKTLHCYHKVLLNGISAIQATEADNLFIKAVIGYAKNSMAVYDTVKTIRTLHHALTKAKKCNKETYQVSLHQQLSKYEWLNSRYDKAIDHFNKGKSLALKIGDSNLLNSINTSQVFCFYWVGKYKECIETYEKMIPEVERYPQKKSLVLAALTIGRCYANIGNFTQGLGIINGLRTQCLERGDRCMAAHGAYYMGVIMLDNFDVKRALKYLTLAFNEAKKEHYEWIKLMAYLALAYAHHIDGNNQESIKHLKQHLETCRKVGISVPTYSYLMSLLWSMKEGKLPQLPNCSIEAEIQRVLKGDNVCLKGVAFRYKALIQMKEGSSPDEVIDSFHQSLNFLELSGHQAQTVTTRTELARYYLSIGREKIAEDEMSKVSMVLSPINNALIPNDLRAFVNVTRLHEQLLKEISNAIHEIVTISEHKDLVQHIISTANQLVGAERGAIFLSDNSEDSAKLRLIASRNISSEEIADETFLPSLNLIKKVVTTGESHVISPRSRDYSEVETDEVITSRICVPMVLKGKIMGVLYHDNKLIGNAFNESYLDVLLFFAGMAAFAIDNIKAHEENKRLIELLREEKQYYYTEQLQDIEYDNIIGDSLAIRHVIKQVNLVAKTDSTVLILGESGVGKDVIAKAIHLHSQRCNNAFIRVNCSSLPESLIASELFGHEKGAFTGAIKKHIGRFELAHGGTLFLDEIGDLPLDIQVRLLGVLQNKEFERVGGTETLHSDFRLVAATNQDLDGLVKIGKFREDLYYRINVFPIHVPPLRKRKEDIPALSYYFLNKYSKKMMRTFTQISNDEMEKLILYDWPGNVRELENIIERGCILSGERYFQVPESLSMAQIETDYRGGNNVTTLKEVERHHILKTLEKTGWKVWGPQGAAALLDINPSTLAFRMKKLGIQKPRSPSSTAVGK
ncbi:MAG TPA: hypothetical protein DDY17_09590 [Syntrophaceae bacterium]|nr:hypothetical protein [Syntrophaceae bacterium]